MHSSAVLSRSLDISVCSLLGLWTRIGLQLSFATSPPFFNVIAANVVGCFTLSFFLGLHARRVLSESQYTALAVGYCGSCTSYSAWSQSVSLFMLSQDSGSAPDSLYAIFVGFALPLFALSLGNDASSAV